jgi:hypothetical protein
VIEALEGLVGGPHGLEIMDDAILRREREVRCPGREPARQAGREIQMGRKRGEQGGASTVEIWIIVCDRGIVPRSSMPFRLERRTLAKSLRTASAEGVTHVLL